MTSAGESDGLIASAIQNWYAEKSNYNFATGDCGSGQCGHYTQVSNIEIFAQFSIIRYICTYGQIVWAQSYLVGCGSSYCQSVAGFGPGTIIVCDYAPGLVAYSILQHACMNYSTFFCFNDRGNYVGEAPYTKGTPCSMCPAMWTECYSSLCCK